MNAGDAKRLYEAIELTAEAKMIKYTKMTKCKNDNSRKRYTVYDVLKL